MSNIYQSHLQNRQTQESNATNLLVALAQLGANNVNVLFFGERLPLNVAQILAKHDQNGVNVADSLTLAQALVQKGVADLPLDLAQAVKAGKKADDFATGESIPTTDVVLYGFGRIGRILARLLMSRPASDKGLQLKSHRGASCWRYRP